MARKLLRDDPSWQRIEHWLPGKQGNAGRSASDNRLSVEAVCWIACTGAPWRNLPPDLEPWSSMHKHFSRWEARGRAYSRSSRKDADFKALSLATLVRAHQHAAGAAKKRLASTRALAWRIEHQDSCASRRIGSEGALVAEAGTDT